MKKGILGLMVVLAVVGAWGQPGPGGVGLVSTTTTTGGSVSAINTTLGSIGSGGTVYVMPGHYFISNNAPVIVPTGVTLQGLGTVIFEVDTNGGNDGRLNYSTFQAKDNSTIRNITWLATNGWNTTTTVGAYASFLRSGPVYTNVLVEQCDLQGGSDVFYATNSSGSGFLKLFNNKITSYWDFNSGGAGVIIGRGNTWNGLGDASRASRVVLTSTYLLDDGQWNGFAGFDTASSAGPWAFHGAVMNFSPTEGHIFNSTRTDLTGDYVDTVKGISYSLTAERASYVTNGFTTNITYSMNISNIYVASTSGDANKTGRYAMSPSTLTGDFSSGQAFFTNQSHPTVVLWLNDPEGVSLEGGPPTFTIRTNFGAGVIIAIGQWPGWANVTNFAGGIPENTVTTSQPFSLGDGDQTATIAVSTNAITTNAAANLQPAIFQGKVSWVSNAVLEVPNVQTTYSNYTTAATARTMNTWSGKVLLAAGSQTYTVTDSYVTSAASMIGSLNAIDATATNLVVVPGSGSFTLSLNKTATANLPISWTLVHQ